MAVNKVIYDGKTLMDTSGVTVTPETLDEGVTALNAAGELITGVARKEAVLYVPQSLTEEQRAQARENIGASTASADGGPGTVVYRNPTKVPIRSGMQMICYASCAGTYTFAMGNAALKITLADAMSTVQGTWVQTTDMDGSLIYANGGRTYLITDSIVRESAVTFEGEKADASYIVITITSGAGADGYSPVKGVDYYTEADKTEIVNDVLASFIDVSEVGM